MSKTPHKRTTIRREISSPEFIRLSSAYKKWLEVLNYNPVAVYSNPRHLQEFFHWLEESKKTILSEINNNDINGYYEYLQTRGNYHTGGRLSRSTLAGHIGNLRLFAKYLRETGQATFEVNIQIREDKRRKKRYVFSREQIRVLYESCSDDEAGYRDRAMLDIFYGCGLRRKEGVNLNIKDFMPGKNLLHVRVGKGYKERYVPMAEGIKESLQEYLNCIRPLFIKDTAEKAFLLNKHGRRLDIQSVTTRFRQLKDKAEIQSPGGVHTLRHSIATQLLQSGMPLQQIKIFLGHSSLESTQIYTHIINEQ